MHKEVPVVQGTYSYTKHQFLKAEVLEPSLLPVGVCPNGVFDLHALNHWFIWRGIPQYRVGLAQLEQNLDIESPLDLLEKSHALSLSDTYWIKETDSKLTFQKCNFFHRPFDQEDFGRAMFSSGGIEDIKKARHTPNNTTCGYHRKAWFKQGNTHILRKGGSGSLQLEPINEWLAGCIASQLGLYAIPYNTEIYLNKIVSVCPRMTDENTDLVTAESILKDHSPMAEHPIESYIRILENHGISNARKVLSDQFVLDYLLLNFDRHTQNMGILVDANTNAYLSVAPVFDTGSGLGCLVSDTEVLEEAHAETYKLFNLKHLPYEYVFPYILWNQYDFSGLTKLPQLYGEKLVQYRSFNAITNQRIENTYVLFYKRILTLKKAALHSIR